MTNPQLIPSRPLERPIRFVLAGGLAAVANFGSRILFSLWLAYPVAIVLAFLVGMTVAFTLIRRFVFPNASRGLLHQAFWFVVVNLAALLQTLAVSLVLADFLLPRLGIVSYVDAIAHAAGIVTPIVTSYIAHQRLTFR